MKTNNLGNVSKGRRTQVPSGKDSKSMIGNATRTELKQFSEIFCQINVK